MSFSDFNLLPEFVKSIEAAGYKTPTPLQSQLIPLVEGKKNVLVWTQSASGKTGAFLIPAMNYILENPAPEKRGARILILTSRRDRVSQINYTIKRLSADHVMRFGFIVSGRPYQTQMRLMRRPLDIMIATPGRLNDLMSNGKADFSQLEMLIIDDLTSIYKKNLQGLVEQILKQAGDTCSTLTFVSEDENTNAYAKSLFPEAVQVSVDGDEDDTAFRTKPETGVEDGVKDSRNPTNNPPKKVNKVEAAPAPVQQLQVPENLMAQKVHVADDYTHKIAMMDHLMDEFAGESTIIYTATNKAAKTLQDNLSNHGHAAELIDDVSVDEIKELDIVISSDQQKTVLEDDIYPHIDSHIIHFDLPRKTEQYLKRLSHHQQDRDDEALIMVDGYNFNELKHIEKTLGESLEQITVPGLEPLNPFVNLSKGKPSNNRSNSKNSNQSRNKNTNNKNNRSSNNSNNKPRQNAKNGKPNNPRARNKNNAQNRAKNPNQNTSQNQDDNQSDPQRRQRKGAFGRLNGGAQRKRSNNQDTTSRSTNGGRHSNGRSGGRNVKVGVSTRGTAPPPGSGGDRGWKADPQERKVEKSKVVIRYSKKRLMEDKPDET